ncbi:hypothetical protein J5N97_022538 [Dioscorea zingiberensis]|uniref:Late embryogenesis abundant protein LEA-2 subgroup domain-containing protein n=1 Tax=Dioscorea zingiberensis TaxID=325984 RepID=A0A9D5HAM6_9LILI|nr:hypothetical protein J5N97_022538 [Dioscorea zingiberensis]
MSAKKECGHHGHHKHHKLLKFILGVVLVIIILILLAILIIWLVLRPTRPRFFLQDTSIYQLNLTSPNYLTTTLQLTISSRNPNDRVGIYYDHLDTYVSYKGQQITLATALPKGYQGHHDVSIWSPYLYGTNVPLAPFLMASLGQDENAGFLLLYVHVDGKLRWRVGSWMSGHYHIGVSCPAFFTCDADKGSFHFQQTTSCSVDV